MSLGIWKKLAALLSVICISVAVSGCGPAAETPTAGDGANNSTDENQDEPEDQDGDELVEDISDDDGGAEDEGASLTE